MSKFNGSYNEWDDLEEVIIGSAFGAQRSKIGIDQLVIEYNNPSSSDIYETGPFPQKVIEETEEDLETLIEELIKLKIKVKRPSYIDHQSEISTHDWKTNGFYNYCPRDSILVIGDNIIEAPMTMRSRFLEQFSYKTILIEYLKNGAKWFSAPKPRLLDEIYNTNPNNLGLNNLEPIFDAANIIRAGKDLFYLISNTGNELGAFWLQNILGEKFNINICKNIYNGIHIDSTISFLRPGLVLLNPERVNDQNIPEKLKKWDKIWCPEIVDTGFVGKRPLSSIWVGMNIFMINPYLAIVDSNQKALIKKLEQNKIEVLPLVIRHARTLGGGFHCVTLDTRRKSKFESYF